MKKFKDERIIDENGEVLDTNNENLALAKRELNELVIFDEWLEKKEMLETAKEQFSFVDKPFRTAIKDLFTKYSIKKLDNDYLQIVFRNGYTKTSWDSEKVKALIYRSGLEPEDFQTVEWVEGTINIKYKG